MSFRVFIHISRVNALIRLPDAGGKNVVVSSVNEFYITAVFKTYLIAVVLKICRRFVCAADGIQQKRVEFNNGP